MDAGAVRDPVCWRHKCEAEGRRCTAGTKQVETAPQKEGRSAGRGAAAGEFLGQRTQHLERNYLQREEREQQEKEV